MTDTTSDTLDARRRRLIYRSWYCGIKEMDLLLGRFAKTHMASLTEEEVDAYEQLLADNNDPRLYRWITAQEDVPAELDTALLRKIRDYATSPAFTKSPFTEAPQ
ncbi:MAG: succinate dehydrogenase assembly factor 2 [Alphaproteobacteria bacterium]|nr:succinate dehydrogenase assembly factor 2 [Alphaproteobacteria bacterium]